jgi:secreted trypsin-like serine protease
LTNKQTSREKVLSNIMGKGGENEAKQAKILDMFKFVSDEEKNAAKAKMLEFKVWPQPDADVVGKFVQQPAPGSFTGCAFSPGSPYVLTAAHCCSDPASLFGMVAVFNMTLEMVNAGSFPRDNVYAIKRCVSLPSRAI